MANPKGYPNPNIKNFAGNRKGKPNKMNADVRQEIFETAQEIGVKEWAKENKTAFMTIIFPKIIPKDINVTGEIWTRTLTDEELDTRIQMLLDEEDALEQEDGQ